MTDQDRAETAGRPSDSGAAGGDEARQLFKYVTVDEWRDYRAIMAVFAGTFFAEFGPDDVVAQLQSSGYIIDAAVATNRLESLRNWGNLTVSSSVGSPTSIADYYRRRNRYLITRAGQEVHEAVEGVLTRVDEVRDVSTSRLRALHEALRALRRVDVDQIEPALLADAVRAVFDPHDAFTSEITQFFAAINQWQSRYDLSVEEFTFFAEVLVGYVAERLDEIERTSRPIGRLLGELEPAVPAIVARSQGGLASRVAEAGLGESVTVTKMPGSTIDDWRHLADWFVARAGSPSRIERLTGDAVSAIRTLTLNLTRLSRIGVGASSRRADLLRLARFFAEADPGDEARLAVAAFGLHPTNHWGVLADDTDDPVSSTTPWSAAARASVPISLRERGNTTNRGRTSPMRDRSLERRALLRRREQELEAQRRVDAELLASPQLHGRDLSAAALTRLQHAVARTMQRFTVHGTRHSAVDGMITCTIERTPGRDTVVSSADGTLTLHDLSITVAPVDGSSDGVTTGVETGEAARVR